MVIADLDGFKTINDHHGHAVGDVTLTTLAAEMLQGVRSVDKVGRIGGDEFAVLLPETSSARPRCWWSGSGAERWPQSRPTGDRELRGVDVERHGAPHPSSCGAPMPPCTQAKRRGRNRIAVWSDSCVPPHPDQG